MEVGTHSPWLSRWLASLGFEVIVANARQVPLISASSRKNDRMDARMLARLGRRSCCEPSGTAASRRRGI
jgi:transposase